MSDQDERDSPASLDHLRSPGRGMNFGRASIGRVASVLVPLLAEISRGETSLRAELIFELEREDPEWARIMTALLMLHGDIDYRLKAAEIAGAERHQSARYVAVGMLLDAVLDPRFGSEGSSQGVASAERSSSIGREIAALRSAVAGMPPGEAVEQVRGVIRSLEARLGADAEFVWTREDKQRESTLAITVDKLEMTASEALAYLGRLHSVQVPPVSAEAELRWTKVSAGVRLWWIRAIETSLAICARENVRMVGLSWAPAHLGEETPPSLRIAIDADSDGMNAVEQHLSTWAARLEPSIVLTSGGHPWQVERRGGEFFIGVEAAAFERPAVSSGMFLHRNMRVVVVDDEPIIASVVHRVLSRRLSVPCDFQVFTSSEEALNSLSMDSEVDLVISDVNMPSISGQDLYARSVEMNESLSHRFVFVSGMELPVELLESFRLGMVEFVRKPFRPEELVDAVNRVVERISSSVAAQ